ncbi:MAG: metallophosphoesterase [bacterium]
MPYTRREFLKRAGMCAAATGLAYWVPPSAWAPAMMSELETRDYHLAFAPLTFPTPFFPAMTPHDGTLGVEFIGTGRETGWNVILENGAAGAFRLKVQDAGFERETGKWKIFADTLREIPPELYTLRVGHARGEWANPRAVKVIDAFRPDFSFAHVTDVHVGCAGNFTDEGFPPTEEVFGKVIEEINLIDPEFVVATGDMVHTAVDNAWEDRRIEGNTAEGEYVRLFELMSRFRVPVYVLPGNHDIVGTIAPVAQRYWEEHVGRRYFSFEYGNRHFTALDDSHLMEGTPFMYADKFTHDLEDAQLKWLKSDLAAYGDRALKVLLYHVPLFGRRSTVPELAMSRGVKMALFGHEHWDRAKRFGDGSLWVETKSVLDYGGYRIVRVRGGDVVSWSSRRDTRPRTKRVLLQQSAYDMEKDNLPHRYSLSAFRLNVRETRRRNEYVAVIENGLDETFDGALLRVGIGGWSGGAPRVDGGTLERTVGSGESATAYVRARVPGDSTVEVRVFT